MPSSGMLRRVAVVRTDDWEERSASIVRVKRSGELGTLAATSNRRTLRRNTMMEALRSAETSVPAESHGVTSQKMGFFIVTAVKTSNLT
jgi:hypothetical protein